MQWHPLSPNMEITPQRNCHISRPMTFIFKLTHHAPWAEKVQMGQEVLAPACLTWHTSCSTTDCIATFSPRLRSLMAAMFLTLTFRWPARRITAVNSVTRISWSGILKTLKSPFWISRRILRHSVVHIEPHASTLFERILCLSTYIILNIFSPQVFLTS